MSTARALLAAHLQASFNRSRKELGKQGQAALIVVMAVMAASLLPLLPLAAFGGYATARGLPQRWAVYLLGGVLGALPIAIGLTAAVLGGRRRLAWESYRIYPVRLGPLFFSEIVAGFGDPWALVYLTLGTAFGLGFATNRPALAPLCLLLFVMSLAWMACSELLVGSLGGALVKRLRWLLVSLGGLLWLAAIVGSQVAPTLRPQLDETGLEQMAAVLRALATAWERLPSTQAAMGLAAAARGDLAGAAGRQAYPFAFTAVLMGLAYVLLARETEPARQANRLESPGRAAGRWTFRHPTGGVARLHWDLLMRSHIGRFAFLFPLATVVVIKALFAANPGLATWGVPAAFAYLALTGSALQFNQFGLDGPGIKGLLVLPIAGRALLLGKLWALAAHQALQMGTLVLLLAVLMRPSLSSLMAGLLVSASLFVLQAGVGHWISVWQPRRMPLDKLRGTNLPLATGLVQLGVSATGMTVLGGAWALCGWLAPAALIPVQLATLGVAIVAYRAALAPAAAYLERQHERLVDRLS